MNKTMLVYGLIGILLVNITLESTGRFEQKMPHLPEYGNISYASPVLLNPVTASGTISNYTVSLALGSVIG